ncbi:1,6-anhydro-N-acetylmuramyl-L-alanine amidase AmpD [Shewanella sairae]|uniref:1,6-anhydro-N-acetylmuramyl-L-alanine amidase AmpD n=1 Tax=Shewanella sairae TaxID=190310 RepID=UPI001C7F17C4|nr:1,6-anhydro-N-acetylmuramyl-L-alanine amidase AmpD [Shewanella sairae]MCL1128919.1 1,6-anhydro-N-acetylmuramyl-L-alanine amidase AmpD [Shewanella sairae]
MGLTLLDGWVTQARHCLSPHFNQRPFKEVSLLVIHNISLPAGCFGLPYIEQLFLGKLDIEADNSFKELQGLEVSAHFLIRRDGELVQYVSCDDRAWHAGVSQYDNRQACNDFSIGIELEGTDDLPYSEAQYLRLVELTKSLMLSYPLITPARITGHSDIAPGRKTDPGSSFDWQRYKAAL